MNPLDVRIVVAGEKMRAGDLVSLERRTWRERLFSRPWRPWVAWRSNAAGLWQAMNKNGVREIPIAEAIIPKEKAGS